MPSASDFSILMAFYRGDQPSLLDNSLKSIYSNTLQPKEVILVQDGNVSDDLLFVINKYSFCDGFRLVVCRENIGLPRALNEGLKYCHYRFTIRLDADDVALPGRFQKQIDMIEQGYDLVGGAILEVDNHKLPVAIRQPLLTQDAISIQLSKRNPFNHMTVAFRTDFVRKCGGYPDVYLKEDYALWATMISNGARVANTSDILVHATAGREMYQRRGGLRYVKSEVALQSHLLKCGVTTLPKALLYGFLRSVVFLIPSRLRGRVYETFLRKRVQAQ